MSALKEAFVRAGMPPAATRFLVACQELALEALAKRREDPGRAALAWLNMAQGPKFRDGALREFIVAIAESLQPKTATGATRTFPQGHEEPSPSGTEPDAAAGVKITPPRGHETLSPAATPSVQAQVIPKPSRVNREGWEGVMHKSVLDTFMIETRDGNIAIGDLYIASIDRQIRESGRRAFIGAGQYNVLLALRDTAKRKAAHIPQNAKVRTILEAEEVRMLIDEACVTLAGISKILLPKALDLNNAAA